MLLDAIIFGAFVGSLTDYWLGRLTKVTDPARLVIAVAVAVIIGILVVYGHHVAYF